MYGFGKPLEIINISKQEVYHTTQVLRVLINKKACYGHCDRADVKDWEAGHVCNSLGRKHGKRDSQDSLYDA